MTMPPKPDKEEKKTHGNFTKIPNMLCEGAYPELEHDEKWLYVCLKALCKGKGTRYLSLRYIAKKTGFPLSTLSKKIPRLQKAGLVHCQFKKRLDEDGNEYGNVQYHVTIADKWEENDTFYGVTCSPDEHQEGEDSKPVREVNEPVHVVNTSVPTVNEPVPDSERTRSRGSTSKDSQDNKDKEDRKEEGAVSHAHAEIAFQQEKITEILTELEGPFDAATWNVEQTAVASDHVPPFGKEAFRPSSTSGDVTQGGNDGQLASATQVAPPSQHTSSVRLTDGAARLSPAAPLRQDGPRASGASQPSLRMRDGPAPQSLQQEINADKRHLWAVIEEVTKMEFSRTTRESKHNKPGIENLIQDGISDEKLRKALTAMMDSPDAWLRTNFNVSLFHERIPGLLQTKPGQVQHGRTMPPAPQERPMHNRRNFSREFAEEEARAAR